MVERVTKVKLFKYIIEALTLALILGLICGSIVGVIRGWKYASKGFYLPVLDTLNFSVSESLLIAFLFVLLYLFIFFVLYRVIKNTKWTCFVSSAVILVPAFLYLGYRVNRVYFPSFFELKSIIWNSAIGIGFIVLWLLVSIGLFFWTRSRILKTSPANVRGLGLLLGVVLAFNVSIFLFNRLYTADSPNVIILLVDALRADHLSSYGYSRNTTPNIDEFAKNSVIFTQAISQSTFTKTSVASLFTSRYPYQHGIYQSYLRDDKGNITSDILDEKETTLAEALLQNGFLTVAWVRNPQLQPYMGFAQGFVEYSDPISGVESINKKFIEWIDRVGKKQKFFAYIHYLDLHDPYRPEPPYDTMYGIYSDIYPRIGVDHSRIGLENWRSHLGEFIEGGLEGKDVDQLMAYYDGQLTYIDTQIGILLKELKRLGLYDNTLIVLTADHGDGFMEHGFISHSNTPYDELTRVPLIIKFPNSPYGGSVVKNQVQLIDVMPTVLDFLNIRIDNSQEGFSLLNYLNHSKGGDKKKDFPDYAYTEYGSREVAEKYSFYSLSIRAGGFKYIHLSGKKDEFYDLNIDPKEQNDIIDLKPNEAEKFRRIALSVVSERRKKDVKKVNVDNNAIEDIKALGYIE